MNKKQTKILRYFLNAFLIILAVLIFIGLFLVKDDKAKLIYTLIVSFAYPSLSFLLINLYYFKKYSVMSISGLIIGLLFFILMAANDFTPFYGLGMTFTMFMLIFVGIIFSVGNIYFLLHDLYDN